MSVNALIESWQPDFSLPAEFYVLDEIFQADLRAVFHNSWIYGGHVSQIAESGQFLLVEFGAESVILCRDRKGQVHGFANVCRHRGSRICLEKSGRVSAFICPYHAWTYELDGRLRTRRDMPDDYDPGSYSLHPVAVEIFHGLVFINLDLEADSLLKSATEFSSALQIYQLENTRVACEKSFVVDANWKLAIENFMECYHCTPAHPEYSCSHALNSPRDYEALRPQMLDEAARCGYTIEALRSNPESSGELPNYFYNRSALYPGFVTGSESGEPVAPLLGKIPEYGGGAADVALGHGNYAILYADHAVIYRFLPLARQQTKMDIIWLVNKNAEAGRDYDLEELTWLWTVTTEADKKIILNNQNGINSKFYQPGPLAEAENYVTEFYRWYIRQLKISISPDRVSTLEHPGVAL